MRKHPKVLIPSEHARFIGRQGAIRLSDPYCSRRHALIYRCPAGGARIIDLGSRNGTFVNGRPVTDSPLHSGDTITIGNTSFVIQLNFITNDLTSMKDSSVLPWEYELKSDPEDEVSLQLAGSAKI